jgi:hypothetical protein
MRSLTALAQQIKLAVCLVLTLFIGGYETPEVVRR